MVSIHRSPRLVWLCSIMIAGLIVACSSGEHDEGVTNRADVVEVDVLLSGVEIIRTHALYADRIDWEQVEGEVERLASERPSSAEVHRFLRELLAQLDDRHSQLILAPGSGTRVPPSLPSGDVERDVGYLSLPPFSSSPHVDGYAWAAHDVLARPACGWIIDLRFNRGGNTPAMLAALAPLFTQGPVMGYQRRDGTTEVFSFDEHGRLLGPDGATLVDSDDTPMVGSDLPVAVLQYRRTASAAEAALVALRARPGARSFGTPSFGVPTGNVAHHLPDGTVISLTIGAAVDPDGRRHDGPIDPDELIQHAPIEARPRDDVAFEAAMRWVRAQPPC